MWKILIRKEIENAFAQKKFIYMMIGMSILFPFLIPMFDNNQLLMKFIPASLFACIIPNYIALNCASQLVVNSHIEEVKLNLPKILQYKRINRAIYYISKISIPFMTGVVCGMLSSLIFYFINGPISMNDLLIIIITNFIWSLIPTIVTITLTTLGIDDEITLNTVMIFANLAIYGLMVFLANPLENFTLHLIYTILIAIIFLFITNLLINRKIIKLEEKNDGQCF